MELFDLYNASREKTGRTLPRGELPPEGYYYLVVHVCIFNPRGQMLIQERQPFKKGWSGFWDVSMGGKAIAGDTSRSAAERETREELGLSLDLSGARPSVTLYLERSIDDFYVLTLPVSLDSLRPQPEEVRSLKWASKEEILRMIDDGIFIPYEKSFIEFLFFRKDHRDSHTKSDPTRRAHA